MRNTILYLAHSADEVHECSYSLLKYLDVYNLKPPASHHVVVYTHDPASLESYSSFFSHFELRDPRKDELPDSEQEMLQYLGNRYEGNLLYLGCQAYPVQELDSLLASLEGGRVILNRGKAADRQQEGKLQLLGYNNLSGTTAETALSARQTNDGSGYIETYGDLKEFRLLLRKFFKKYQEESIPNQVKLMHTIDAVRIGEQKKRYAGLPLFARVVRRLTGSAWNISAYTKKI